MAHCRVYGFLRERTDTHMIVIKFGGTSVRNAEWIDRALDIAESKLDKNIVLVSSATGKTTDKLQEISNRARQGAQDKTEKLIGDLSVFHFNIAGSFLSGNNLAACEHEMKKMFNELRAVTKGMSLLKECTARSNDLILSFGERLATQLLAHRSKERGIETELLDARNLIKTDNNFSQAQQLEAVTNELIRKTVKPRPDVLIITQGFIGSTVDNITTTLGRNRSDLSAIIIGAALDAEEVQIWTDVDGIMTADPKIVTHASTIPVISYREAAELAYFGARVIHPSAIQPAVNRSIPVSVKNTGNPQGIGTRIVPGQSSREAVNKGPKGIAFKCGITVINISSGRMLQAYGFLKNLFEVFEKYKTSVDLIATSEVSVSVTIENTTLLDDIILSLEKLGSVSTEEGHCIVCLVGQDLWKMSNIISRVFSTLKQVTIRMISLGSSDTNLSFVVPPDRIDDTIKSLHHEFFENPS